MKNTRHEKILELISKNNIETQEEFARLLVESGFDVTQATVSRDIKKLNLVKVKAANNRQRYMTSNVIKGQKSDKLIRVLSDSIVSMEEAGNILVIKTSSGMAMAAAAAVDALKIPEIIGSIAGDDTIMCAIKDSKQVKKVIEAIRGVIY